MRFTVKHFDGTYGNETNGIAFETVYGCLEHFKREVEQLGMSRLKPYTALFQDYAPQYVVYDQDDNFVGFYMDSTFVNIVSLCESYHGEKRARAESILFNMYEGTPIVVKPEDLDAELLEIFLDFTGKTGVHIKREVATGQHYTGESQWLMDRFTGMCELCREDDVKCDRYETVACYKYPR